MAFRADESAQRALENLKNNFIPRNIDADERMRSEDALDSIVEQYGPVVESYPTWHPLVPQLDDRMPVTQPDERCGYRGLDHTRYFANAFVTCPYGDGQDVLDSVDKLQDCGVATIEAEHLDVKLYRTNTPPILVYCDWHKPIDANGIIPASIAIPLLLQKEVSCWEWASYPERWETMRYYFLGSPHGARSSHFVDQDTAVKMKKIWNLLISTGMFG